MWSKGEAGMNGFIQQGVESYLKSAELAFGLAGAVPIYILKYLEFHVPKTNHLAERLAALQFSRLI